MVANRFAARAVTFGPHVFLGAGEHPSDLRLLAHEAAHALQQAQSEASPHPAAKPIGKPAGELDFERKLQRIDSLLSYGFFDWAITDAEALEALGLLESMRHVERTTAMSHVNIRRLRDNLPAQHLPRLDLIVSETRPTVAETSGIHDLLSYGVFDWAITDAEASQALALLEKMAPEQRMHALMGLNRRRLFENLPTQEQKARLEELWTEAHALWSRQRQQHDPLSPGDRLRIRVWNAIGQEEEVTFGFREYVIDADHQLEVPLLAAKVPVRNLRPSDIEARITALLKDGYLRAPIVSVEVIQRGGERFEARGLPISTEPAPPETKHLPGDTFEMRVLDTSTWTEESDLSGNFQIDAGGSVKLKHFGLVDVAGLTAAEIEDRVRKLLAGWFKRPPTIWVWTTSHGGNIYVPPPYARPTPAAVHSMEAYATELARMPIPTRREIDVWLDFVRGKEAELADPKISERDKRIRQEALIRFLSWLRANDDEAKLTATNPWEVWGRIHTPILIATMKKDAETKVKKASKEHAETEHNAAVQARLDVYWTWAMNRWKEAGVVFRSLGPAYLLTENPLRKQGMDAIISAVLTWAHSHTDDPALLTKSPEEVAEYLMARDPHLAAMVEIGRTAPPLVEYFPELDRTRYTMGELATETAVGFIPVIGDIIDAITALEGRSLTGHEMETDDRLLTALGALIPFVPGSALRGGKHLPEVVTMVAAKTGRNADEIHAIFRVAGHLDQVDVKNLERIIGAVNEGRHLSPADLQVLDNIALKLKHPLEEAAKYLAKGKQIPIGKLRADIVTGTRFIPGTAEHKAQRWIEYQFRHPGRFPSITGKIDPNWERLYDGIVKNKRVGGAFESEVLGALKYEKNTAMMIPKVESGVAGFIPDAVKGNPTELIWGQAYHFTEVKGWKEMSDTGNLSAMIHYVDTFGGHLEVVFRSSKHPQGLTTLSKPLQRELDRLVPDRATILRYP